MLSRRSVAVCMRVIGLGLGCSLLVMAFEATAAVPQKISYQGRLTDTSGNPLPGDHTAMFVIYDDQVEGVVVWSEQKTITADADGVFSTILGSVTPIDCSFTEPRWLEVYVDGLGLAPRREIVSVASALDARSAATAGNADSLGHAPAASYSPVGHVHDDTYPLRPELSNPGTINQPTNPVDWSKLKNVPPGFADGTDAEGGAGDGHSLDAADGHPLDVVYVDGAGKVGIGTQTPEVSLHVYGGSAGAISAAGTLMDVVVEDDYSAVIGFLSRDLQGLYFGDSADVNPGYVVYDHRTDEMSLGTDNATRLTILNDGKIGIGTEDPESDLHVRHNVNGITAIEIENTNTGTNSTLGIKMKDETGNLGGILMYDDGSTYPNDMRIFNERPSGDIRFTTYTAQDLVVADGGKVGVGILEPEAPLHVYAGSAGTVTASTVADVVIEDDETAALSFLSPSANAQGLYFGDAADNVDGWVLYDHSTDRMRLGVNNNNGLAILSDGKVGIGTTEPESDLHVVHNFNGSTGIKIENTDPLGGASESIWFGDESGINTGITAYGDAVAGGANCMQIFNNRADGAIYLVTNGFERVWVAHDGDVGIGTKSPGYKLDVAGAVNLNKDIASGVAMRVNGDEAIWYNGTYFSWGFGGGQNYFADEVGIGTTTPGSYELYVAGDAYATGAWQGSDGRFKEGIRTVEGALAKIGSLRGVSFNWKTEEYKDRGFPDGRHYGVIAQEVERVLPEVVKEGPQGEKAVAYTEIVPILVEAVKELRVENQELRARIQALEQTGTR